MLADQASPSLAAHTSSGVVLEHSEQQPRRRHRLPTSEPELSARSSAACRSNARAVASRSPLGLDPTGSRPNRRRPRSSARRPPTQPSPSSRSFPPSRLRRDRRPPSARQTIPRLSHRPSRRRLPPRARSSSTSRSSFHSRRGVRSKSAVSPTCRPPRSPRSSKHRAPRPSPGPARTDSSPARPSERSNERRSGSGRR